MELINNINKTLRDDLASEIKVGSRLSIAAACFSIYAFQELKSELQGIDELRFIFTSPTFTTEKAKKEKREFYIPRLNRERMQLNAEDGGHRKFIMVQMPEKTDEKSEAYKAGYKNICEIGKERIRRAGAKIKEENPLGTMDLDVGFRVLKCDTTNMKNVYYHPDEYNSTLFDMLEDNIKEDRTPEDLLFQVMLDLGVLLSSKIEQTEIAGKKVFTVADNFLIACFDANVTEETITAIAKQKPYYFVMRDSSLANDSVAANFDQIFATYSPDTVRKVL